MKPLDHLTDDELVSLARRAAALPDAPESLIRSALRLWPAAAGPSLAEQVRAGVQRILATLQFDSWATAPMAMGVRGVPSATRQLLFSAAGRDVDLRVSASGERFAVRGQLLGPDESGTLRLMAVSTPEEAPRHAAIDDLGEFRFDDLAPGTYAVTLQVRDAEIELPPIELGERRA